MKRASGVLCLVAALVLESPAVVSASVLDVDGDSAVAACAAAGPGSSPAAAPVLELLIAAPAASMTLASRYRRSALHVLALACGVPGTRVVIRAITPTSFVEPALFNAIVPIFTSINPLIVISGRKQFMRDAIDALDSLSRFPAPGSRRTDVLSALALASQDGSNAPKKLIVVLQHGWPGYPELYVSGGRAIGAREPEIVASRRRNGTMPAFSSSTLVVLAGLTAGQMEPNTPTATLCQFYKAFVRDAGGEFGFCAADLPEDVVLLGAIGAK
jgi:hypothetical protein